MMGGGMGGMMGGGMMEGMMGGMMRRAQHSGIWAINGVAATGDVMEPFLTLRRGRSYVLAMHNHTAWHHPMHLHGHAFRVIARNGRTTRYQEWQDTVLMAPHESVDIAFVADNPGDWMFHCHILAPGRRHDGRDLGRVSIDPTEGDIMRAERSSADS